MAEYTMIGADTNLFLSKYQLELPSTERMTEFLRKENEGLVWHTRIRVNISSLTDVKQEDIL